MLFLSRCLALKSLFIAGDVICQILTRVNCVKTTQNSHNALQSCRLGVSNGVIDWPIFKSRPRRCRLSPQCVRRWIALNFPPFMPIVVCFQKVLIATPGWFKANESCGDIEDLEWKDLAWRGKFWDWGRGGGRGVKISGIWFVLKREQIPDQSIHPINHPSSRRAARELNVDKISRHLHRSRRASEARLSHSER